MYQLDKNNQSIGQLFSKLRTRCSGLFKAYLLPVMLAVNILFTILNYIEGGERADLFCCRMGNPIYYTIAAVFGSQVIIIFAINLKHNRALEFMGKNTLIIYAFQSAVAISFAKSAANLLGKTSELFANATFKWFVAVFLSLAICVALVYLINGWAPWLIGKWYRKDNKIKVK